MLSMTLTPQSGERIIVLVADGSRANVFELNDITRNAPPTGSGADPSETHGLTLKPVDGMELSAESLERYDLDRHPPAQAPRGNAPSASMSGDPRGETMEQIKHDFAKTIVEKLNQAGEKGDFTQLVLIASPAMLGQIKSGLSKRVTAMVTTSHAADYTHLKGAELLKRINHVVQQTAA